MHMYNNRFTTLLRHSSYRSDFIKALGRFCCLFFFMMVVNGKGNTGLLARDLNGPIERKPISVEPNQLVSTDATDHLVLNAAANYVLRYEIDRSQVPDLYYNELTLKVDVNDSTDVQVIADSQVISHTFNQTTGEVLFTTEATILEIRATGVSELTDLGKISKTTLLNDKGFAWSHGMDDNVGLKKQVDVLEKYGWTGTFFLIAKDIDDTRDEDWVVDTPYLQIKLAEGWALGSHTWDHSCEPPYTAQTIIDGYNRLHEIVQSSTVTDYRLISFAAPCNKAEYHPIILEQRDSGTSQVLFGEGGSMIPFVLDANVFEDILNEETLIADAYAFNFDLPVGRIHLSSEGNGKYPVSGDELARIDWMAQQHNETGQHFWFNTLTHGDNEDLLDQFAGYIYDNHGPAGTDQIWVAPSDKIYSYLLVRDRSVIIENGVFDASGGTVTIPTPPQPEEDSESFSIYLPLTQ